MSGNSHANEFQNATAQEKFMLMLLERVDKLTDEVHHLRISMKQNMLTIPDTKPYAGRLHCHDIGCIANAIFIRVRLDNEDIANEFISVLRNTTGVEAFVYDARPTHEYADAIYASDDDDDDDDDEDFDAIPYVPHGNFTVQALICCKHSMVVSHIGIHLCNAFSETQLSQIELQPIIGFTGMFTNFNHDHGMFKYYYYHITCAKYGVSPSKVSEREMEWIKSDGTIFMHDFMGNAINHDFMGNAIIGKEFDTIEETIEKYGISLHVFPWRKI